MRVKSVMLFLKASVVASADTDLHNKGANVKSTCELNSVIVNRMGKMIKDDEKIKAVNLQTG